jgi:hypothetical protein
MGDVETFRAQFIVRLFLRFQEGFIGDIDPNLQGV